MVVIRGSERAHDLSRPRRALTVALGSDEAFREPEDRAATAIQRSGTFAAVHESLHGP